MSFLLQNPGATIAQIVSGMHISTKYLITLRESMDEDLTVADGGVKNDPYNFYVNENFL